MGRAYVMDETYLSYNYLAGFHERSSLQFYYLECNSRSERDSVITSWMDTSIGMTEVGFGFGLGFGWITYSANSFPRHRIVLLWYGLWDGKFRI